MSHHEEVSKEPESQFNTFRLRVFVASISVTIIFLGISCRYNLPTADQVNQSVGSSQEGQKIATYLSGIKKLRCYFSGSFAVGRVVMFYLR